MMDDLPDGTLLQYVEAKSSHGVTLSIEQFIEWGVLGPVEPDAWGIKSWRQLYDCMTVAENEGDWKECTDALGAALGIGEDSTP